MVDWYPLAFKPIPVARVWGGRRLESLGRMLPPGPAFGESWELSDRAEAQSVVAAGPLEGRTLGELCREHWGDLVGGRPRKPRGKRFPLLIKFLDVRELLSIQVHPDDAMSRGEGKTEAWYFLEAGPGAELYLGLRKGTRLAQVREAVAGARLEPLLEKLRPREGDAAYLPAGTVHAVGGGALIAEVQQNSDTTYRLYDWNRPGLDGKPRELHVEQALAVMAKLRPAHRFHRGAGRKRERALLADSPHFRLELTPRGVFRASRLVAIRGDRGPGRCQILIAVDGEGALRWGARAAQRTPMKRGDVLLLPAALGQTALEGTIRCLRAVPRTE